VKQSLSNLGWRLFLTCPAIALVTFLLLPHLPGVLKIVGIFFLWALLAASFLGMLVVGATSWSGRHPHGPEKTS
jgi:hypothetical protein